MQLKCCTQYPSKLWKLSSGPRTGSQFSFQSQRNTKLKNVQTNAQLSSSHTLTKLMLKILHRRLQKYVIQELPYVQAGFRKGKRSRDQIANIHWIITKAREFQKTSALLTMPKPLTVWNTTNWKILKEMGISDSLTCLLRNMYADQEATVSTGHGKWFQIRKRVCKGCIL